MNIAIVLAAGKGARMKNHHVPKAFIIVKGKPLFYYSLATFQDCSMIDEISLVVPEECFDDAVQYHDIYHLNKIKHVFVGGRTRQESVYNALRDLKINESDIVLIHDSARPLVSDTIVRNNVRAAKKFGAVATAIPSNDTILISKSGNKVESVPKRQEIYCEQTPAAFRFGLILKAHQYALDDCIFDASDDIQLVRRLGVEVEMILGDKLNFKITTEEDLKYFENLLTK